MDTEKIIKGLGHCRKTACESCPYNVTDDKNPNPGCLIDEMLSDALAMLKKQQDQIWELQELNEYLQDKIKEHEPVVRCKECKYRGESEKCVLASISEEKDFPLFMLDNRGDWFCADGVRR